MFLKDSLKGERKGKREGESDKWFSENPERSGRSDCSCVAKEHPEHPETAQASV